jgi:hypothetical protein
MKQQYIIFGILTLIFTLFYVWTKTKKQDTQNSEKLSEKKNLFEKMEIKKTDLEQTKDLNDLLYDLTEKYYPDYDDETFDNLDVVSQTFALIIDADGQINNGGIIQFIDNGTGNRFHETIDAVKRIDSEVLVELLTRASRQFPNGQIPKDWDDRRDLYDELCEKYITFKTFDELNLKEQQIVLENRKKFGDTTPLDECRYEQKNNWSDTWGELDSLYYDNAEIIHKSLVEYLKKNAKLID